MRDIPDLTATSNPDGTITVNWVPGETEFVASYGLLKQMIDKHNMTVKLVEALTMGIKGFNAIGIPNTLSTYEETTMEESRDGACACGNDCCKSEPRDGSDDVNQLKLVEA